jgi:hypothetical protein
MASAQDFRKALIMLSVRRTVLKSVLMAAALVGALAFATVASHAADPLPSWNDGPAKQSIISFVERVTNPSSPDFVPAPERIATFDNDGTLWCEQPIPVQLFRPTEPIVHPGSILL